MHDKQMKLQGFLKDLAKEDAKISERGVFEECIRKLQYIYSDDFRHLYSEVFGIITRIDGKSPDGLDILSRNIQALYKQAIEENGNGGLIDDTLCKKIAKLYDHVNLDIARIAYTRNIANELKNKHENMSYQLKAMKDEAEQAQRSMQREYITILGIFSSIVITFVAGMAFSTSILGNIDKASIYRLILIIAIVGLGLFNLVNLLLRFIQRINRGYELERDENAKQIETINTVIFLIIIIDFIAWLVYWWRFN
ncbi:hypothetical protein TAMA11512_21490 [Selenomonas sp. TAMA-11512]|nr:hypothetical protein TAMA11512_21490 [Selenomonas sp. TAMA-11512]